MFDGLSQPDAVAKIPHRVRRNGFRHTQPFRVIGVWAEKEKNRTAEAVRFSSACGEPHSKPSVNKASGRKK
jgi:hypothetical protein